MYQELGFLVRSGVHDRRVDREPECIIKYTMIDKLLRKYALLSDQVDEREVELVLRALLRALQCTETGAVVEFGCYVGTTSLFIARLLQQEISPREFHVYDSFAGLPEKGLNDQSGAGDQFVAGALHATKKQFILNFKKAGLPLPHVHKGWFHEMTASDIPDRIAFAFLDGDYYKSIATSLQLVWPRLVPGAVVVVDDYTNEALPGAVKAVDEWLVGHPAKLHVEHSLAVLHPASTK